MGLDHAKLPSTLELVCGVIAVVMSINKLPRREGHSVSGKTRVVIQQTKLQIRVVIQQTKLQIHSTSRSVVMYLVNYVCRNVCDIHLDTYLNDAQKL